MKPRISVIVPVYNEERALGAFLAMASRWKDVPHEIVFSDGGSTDRTVALLREAGMKVVEGPKGRGGQCDRGVRASCGDIVLFLHADVTVGPDTLTQVAQAGDAGVRWGCLTLRWTLRKPVYRLGELVSNLRVRLAGIPFGDQAPFVERALYDKLGGIPSLPLMEDYEFARRVRAHGIWPRQLSAEVWASPRRFESGGPLRVALQMRRLRRLYRHGVSPEELCDLYRDVRTVSAQADGACDVRTVGAQADGACDVRAGGAQEQAAHGAADGIQGETPGIALVLFTRIPIPGHVKTRLLPVLTPQACAQLQGAMALDSAERLAGLGHALTVCCTDDAEYGPEPVRAAHEFLDAVAQATHHAQNVRLTVQKGESLGDRMATALDAELERGAQACLLLGSDLPLATRQTVREAIGLFDDPRVDVVLCPSEDGGYWLVGLRTPFPELFADRRYGTGSVLDEALALCRAHGRTVALGPVLHDIDTPDDLARLVRHARERDPRVGDRTMRTVLDLAGDAH